MNEEYKIGIVVKSTGSWHLVKHNNKVYSCKIRGKLRTKGYRTTNPVAVGDNVKFIVVDKQTSVITEIINRKNCILRQATNLSKSTHIIACNIDQVFVMATIKSPQTMLEFIDRFLVTAEAYQIPAKIIFNKTDIYNKHDLEKLDEINHIYKKIGYDVFNISVKKNINLDIIKQVLKDKTSLISGNSGVGKSTLLNKISPGLNLKIADISEKYKTGKHTTTYAQMFELFFGGYVIDTPGIKAFGTNFIEKDIIAHNFPEIFTFSQNCKYHNCKHIDEPGCAVKEAFENGSIAFSRYKSYLKMVLDDNNKYRKDFFQ